MVDSGFQNVPYGFCIFKMYNTGWAKSRRALDYSFVFIAEIWEGIDKYWIVPVRKLFYFHH